MKSLIQFIKESLVNESASDYLLLKTYDDAKDYFNNYYYNQNKPLEKTKFGISLEDIKHIYDIANENEKHKKPAPFVGRYGSDKVFVMRRWVESKLDEWRKRSGNDKIQPEWFWTKVSGVYQGPHDTSLKEDNFYHPSAEDMEVIIAFAFNKMLDEKSNKKLDAEQNIKFCTNDNSKKHTQKEENMLNYYADEFNKKFIDNCAKELVKHVTDKLHKLPSNSPTTDEWKKNGSYGNEKTPNNTPKTDLISSNWKQKISLKKAHGAQLMSGAYNEAKATILFAAQDCKLSEEEYNKLVRMLDKPWANIKCRGIRREKKDGNKETKEQIRDYEASIEPIKKYLKDITDPENENYNEDFKKALLIEAASGNNKFGEDSPSAANCVFVWSENETENKFYSSIEDYVNHIINNVNIEIRWKTINSSFQALRIETK